MSFQTRLRNWIVWFIWWCFSIAQPCFSLSFVHNYVIKRVLSLTGVITFTYKRAGISQTKEMQSVYSNQQVPSASSWTYLTKREKSDTFYHYTDIPVKDHLSFVTSILNKIFRMPTTKRLKISIFWNHVGKITPLSFWNLI